MLIINIADKTFDLLHLPNSKSYHLTLQRYAGLLLLFVFFCFVYYFESK